MLTDVTDVPWARHRVPVDRRSAQFVQLATSDTKVLLLATVGAIPVLSGPLATQPVLTDVTDVPWARHRVPVDRRSAQVVLSALTDTQVLLLVTVFARTVHLVFSVTLPVQPNVLNAPWEQPRQHPDPQSAIQYLLRDLSHLRQVFLP